MKEQQHAWSKDDDLVAFYLFKFGDGDLGKDTKEIGELLGMGAGSLKMRIGNFRAIDGGGKLDHSAKQSRFIYERFNNASHEELRDKILPIIAK